MALLLWNVVYFSCVLFCERKFFVVAVIEKNNNVGIVLQNIKELNAAMRKIKLDPRRHNLPEVVEYAIVKRENEALKKNIKQWKRKVAVAEVRNSIYSLL